MANLDLIHPGGTHDLPINANHPHAGRRSTNSALTNENTSSPAWLVPVLTAKTSPLSGRLATGRASMTSLAYVMVSPAQTGLSHLRSRKPGEGPVRPTGSPRARHRLLLAHAVLHDQANAHRARVPARRDQPAIMGTRRGRFVHVERLRVEALRKRLDLLGRKGMGAELGLLADPDVLEVFHARTSRRPNRLTFSWISTTSPF